MAVSASLSAGVTVRIIRINSLMYNGNKGSKIFHSVSKRESGVSRGNRCFSFFFLEKTKWVRVKEREER